jgi:hypothetical protein
MLPDHRTDSSVLAVLSASASQCQLHRTVRDILLGSLSITAVLCLFAAQPALCQDVSMSLPEKNVAAEMNFHAESNFMVETLHPTRVDAEGWADEITERTTQANQPVESDLVVEGLASFGHYKIFASGSDCKLYTAGLEYDRHSWGRFLGARMDYVAEFLPVVLLSAPVTQDIWGTPTSPNRKIVPGIGISPIGFRWIWRDKKAIKPYLMAKGGMLGFTQKALSQNATYENFSLQSAMGLNVKMNQRWDLRLGLFSDFHFSNAFIVPVNPGLDVMNANLGLSYNFGK